MTGLYRQSCLIWKKELKLYNLIALPLWLVRLGVFPELQVLNLNKEFHTRCRRKLLLLVRYIYPFESQALMSDYSSILLSQLFYLYLYIRYSSYTHDNSEDKRMEHHFRALATTLNILTQSKIACMLEFCIHHSKARYSSLRMNVCWFCINWKIFFHKVGSAFFSISILFFSNLMKILPTLIKNFQLADFR